MAAPPVLDKKPHVCPPSDAEHPRDRWESLFVYSFICKYTNLRHKVEGLESPMDFEEAVMSKEPNDILTHVLSHFILNLKPQTRNLSIDLISTTVQSVLGEFLKTSERTIYWNDALNANADPFEASGGGFFSTDWDFKLKILRQLVELQLTHAPSIKAIIDRAWGVVHNKHKKREITPPPEASDPHSRENLQLQPVGQDSSRKRYWVADDSPRVYVSTNPWKITATFQTVSSTREEYIALIDLLKQNGPPEPPKKNHKRTKLEQSHVSLIESLEGRVEAIDAELARVARVRKKIEQRHALMAQAEIRQTRTRRRTQKPDYVYSNGYDSEDDGGDDYRYQDEMDEEDVPGGSRKRKSAPAPTRRSGRTTNKPSTREASPADSWKNWRGERRSTRLGAPSDTQLDGEPASKRSRTDSVASGTSAEDLPSVTNGAINGIKVKHSGAAALKPTEVAVEQIAGKKKSKFWVYAVTETDAPMDVDATTNVNDTNGQSAHANGDKADSSTSIQSPVMQNGSPRHSNGQPDFVQETLDMSTKSRSSPFPMDTT
ncbi:hypothetical protein D9611_005668 [Ephemerocybe angulata]|uniref:WHIM1 domain-containing protein n=1 Tax=Ephemerocybe angulata TaxID=980116 RepID=A0A8H5F4C5_9AGAR|nr:hypothetical protein D9611_005668 [Tulosesus angulatus]